MTYLLYTSELKVCINYVCTVDKMNKRFTIFVCLFNIKSLTQRILKWYSLLISCLWWKIKNSRQRTKITFRLKQRQRFRLIILHNCNKHRYSRRNRSYTHYLYFCLKFKCLSSDIKSVFFSVKVEENTTEIISTAVVIIRVIHIIYQFTWILKAYKWQNQRLSLLNHCLKKY